VLDAAPACVVTDSVGTAPDTTAILLAEPVDPAHAPVPTNDAESLVFRQLYETLVRLDCEGHVRPGLAVLWRQDQLEWTFTLRDKAAFWDGTPLDATTLLEEWHRINPGTAVAGVRSEGRSLSVFLSRPVPPEYFVGPALRVAKRRPDSPWPLGTRPWAPRPENSTLFVGTANGVLRIDSRPGADPRDLLDAGADLLVTRDLRAVAYAEGLGGWTHVPAAWDRLYLLLSPVDRARDTAAAEGIRAGLVRGPLRGEGRSPAPELVTWVDHCKLLADGASRSGGAPAGRRRVVYPRDDAAARALAERLVARAESDLSVLLGLPAAPSGTTVTAAGLDPDAFARALAEPDDLGLILPLFHHGAAECLPVTGLPAGWGLIEPLVETRSHLLVRPGAPRVVRDRDGVVIDPAARR
jgi:hypothetical protein